MQSGNRSEGSAVVFMDNESPRRDVLAAELGRWGLGIAFPVAGSDFMTLVDDPRTSMVLIDLMMSSADGLKAALVTRQARPDVLMAVMLRSDQGAWKVIPLQIGRSVQNGSFRLGAHQIAARLQERIRESAAATTGDSPSPRAMAD
jgi:CheY-like chemotaxis protein